MTTWICELDKDDIKVIAALAHIYLREVPDSPVVQNLLDKLTQQTENVISKNPKDHKLDSIPKEVQEAFRVVESPMIYLPSGALFDE